MLKVDWFPDLPVWCCDGMNLHEWTAKGRPPEALAAQLWLADVERVRSDGVPLGARYFELHYEDLIAAPEKTMEEVLQALDLAATDTVGNAIPRFSLRSTNYKFRDQLAQEQVERIGGLVREAAAAVGYEV